MKVIEITCTQPRQCSAGWLVEIGICGLLEGVALGDWPQLPFAVILHDLLYHSESLDSAGEYKVKGGPLLALCVVVLSGFCTAECATRPD